MHLERRSTLVVVTIKGLAASSRRSGIGLALAEARQIIIIIIISGVAVGSGVLFL